MKTPLAALALLSGASAANAFCTAPPPRECDAYFRADVVVLGTVIADETKYSPSGFAVTLTYRVHVEKTLRGTPHRIVHLTTGNDSGGLRLMRGERRVFFGDRRGAQIVIGCDEWTLSEPKNADAVMAVIEQLKQTPHSAPASIEIQFVDIGEIPIPMSAIHVESAGMSYTGEWTSIGWFKVTVPAGSYSVEVDPAVAEQTIYSLGWWAKPGNLRLSPGQCTQLQFQSKLE